MTVKKLNCRQAHWSLYLSSFNFVMHHCPGKSMGKPDALSHHSNHSHETEDNCDTTLLCPEFFTVCTLKGLTVEGAERDLLCEIH